MKKITIIIAVALCYFIIGCSSNNSTQDTTNNVVELNPEEDLVEAIEAYNNDELLNAKLLFLDIKSEYWDISEYVDTSQFYLDSIMFKENLILKEKRIEDSLYYVNNTIDIINLYPSAPNSAGGVDLNIVWKNNTGKRIKYASFTVEAYNAVNDKVYCDIRGYSSFTGEVTGPIENGQVFGYGYYWDCAWYNYQLKSLKLTRVELEFMDDEPIEIIEGKYVNYL